MGRKAKNSKAEENSKVKTTTSSASSSSSDEHENEPVKSESQFLKDCTNAFATSDLYSILALNKSNATANDIKKAYYRLSLKYHPDKCTDELLKDDCKLKFQLLGKIYSILSDEEKKKLYDECGIIDGEDDLFSNKQTDWESHWRTMFKKITEDDIVNYFKKYKNSTEERDDLFRIYEKHQGNLNKIMEEMISEDAVEDEERFKKMLNEALEKEEVKSYDSFVNEDKKKASKRKAKFEKEAEEAEKLKKERKLDGSEESLKLAILQNAERRKNNSEEFLTMLAKKYDKAEKKGGKKNNKKVETESDDEDIENQDEASEATEDSDESGEEEKKKPKRTSSIIKKKTVQKASSIKSRLSIKRKVKRL